VAATTKTTTTEEKETSGSIIPNDRFADTLRNAELMPGTVEDAAGVERIVVPPSDGWEPAPTEPDEKAVERAKERERAEEEAKQKRLDALKPLPNPGETKSATSTKSTTTTTTKSS